jgi:hypothetical protein
MPENINYFIFKITLKSGKPRKKATKADLGG